MKKIKLEDFNSEIMQVESQKTINGGTDPYIETEFTRTTGNGWLWVDHTTYGDSVSTC
jgi:hypothetical protein